MRPTSHICSCGLHTFMWNIHHVPPVLISTYHLQISTRSTRTVFTSGWIQLHLWDCFPFSRCDWAAVRSHIGLITGSLGLFMTFLHHFMAPTLVLIKHNITGVDLGNDCPKLCTEIISHMKVVTEWKFLSVTTTGAMSWTGPGPGQTLYPAPSHDRDTWFEWII